MTVYISGPITNNPHYDDDFADAYIHLHNLGHNPVNPVDIGGELKRKMGREPTWAEYMREDIKALMDCDGIFMLPGWMESRGASAEVLIAKLVDIKTINLD